jgi:RNA polymerase sigma-70 factor (ECF subfamily)
MTEPTPGAAHWLPSAQAGSKEALGKMLDACRRYLLRIANQELGPDLLVKEGASDLVQKTILEAVEDFEDFHGSSEKELLRWLRRLHLNNIRNFVRHYRAGKRNTDVEQPQSGGQSPFDLPPVLIAPGSTPSEHMMAEEQAQALWQAVERLPDDYREVILLHHQEELPFGEVARLMDRSENAAEHLWLRAIERLRDELVKPR